VNTRIMHPQWPKPDICPTCGHEGNWELVEVDKWLGNTYAFREVVVPPKTEAPVQTHLATPQKQVEHAQVQALRKVDGAVPQPNPSGGKYKPKDAELGIENAANTKELVLDAKTKTDGDGLQSARAPPVSLFAWYILPVVAVGAYLLFVRSRNSKPKSFRQYAGKE